MKKLFVFFAMLVLAATLDVEAWEDALIETISCESDRGSCDFSLVDVYTKIVVGCSCRDGSGFSYEIPPQGEHSSEQLELPTEEDCLAELEFCKDAGYGCSSDAGTCVVKENEEYWCLCYDGLSEEQTGSKAGIYSQEGCNEFLVETCGTKVPSAKDICTDEANLDICLSYFKVKYNTCAETPLLSEESINKNLEWSINETTLGKAIANCCIDETVREEYSKAIDCVKAKKNCNTEECCNSCDFQFYSGDLPESDAASDNGDKADGDSATPATDTEAPAENKEEKKSDGCSMLFV